MTWAGWMVLAYITASAWVAIALFLFEGAESPCRGKALKSGVTAVLVIWIVPALFITSAVFGDRAGRK